MNHTLTNSVRDFVHNMQELDYFFFNCSHYHSVEISNGSRMIENNFFGTNNTPGLRSDGKVSSAIVECIHVSLVTHELLLAVGLNF